MFGRRPKPSIKEVEFPVEISPQKHFDFAADEWANESQVEMNYNENSRITNKTSIKREIGFSDIFTTSLNETKNELKNDLPIEYIQSSKNESKMILENSSFPTLFEINERRRIAKLLNEGNLDKLTDKDIIFLRKHLSKSKSKNSNIRLNNNEAELTDDVSYYKDNDDNKDEDYYEGDEYIEKDSSQNQDIYQEEEEDDNYEIDSNEENFDEEEYYYENKKESIYNNNNELYEKNKDFDNNLSNLSSSYKNDLLNKIDNNDLEIDEENCYTNDENIYNGIPSNKSNESKKTEEIEETDEIQETDEIEETEEIEETDEIDENNENDENKDNYIYEEEVVEEYQKPYTMEEIEEYVDVKKVENKGRCLFSNCTFTPGNIIIVELPVLVAIPTLDEEMWNKLSFINQEQPFNLPPIWHLAAICTLTLLNQKTQQIVLDKYYPSDDTSMYEDAHRVVQQLKLNISVEKYEKTLLAWRYNSFAHHTHKDGLILYNRISMMAHSCHASTCWHFGENDAFVLRARTHISSNEELTISYIGDEDLFKSTDLRREKLSGWLFTCHCELCEAPVDLSRGFRCNICFVGIIYLKSEDSDETYSSACTVCQSLPSEELLINYINLERQSIQILYDFDKSDINIVQKFFSEVNSILGQHWIIFMLNSILFELYRDSEEWEKAISHQKERINYVLQVMPLSSFTLAWLYEELGDITLNTLYFNNSDENDKILISPYHKTFISQYFDNAANLLTILCGKAHEYTAQARNKSNRIQELELS